MALIIHEYSYQGHVTPTSCKQIDKVNRINVRIWKNKMVNAILDELENCGNIQLKRWWQCREITYFVSLLQVP